MPLKPFYLTHFEYEEGDALGKLAALASLAPIFAIVSFCTLIASRRDLATPAFLLGQLLNEAVNAALKRALRQPRPPSQLRHSGPSDFGMPSAHAQFCFFFCVYFTLWGARHWRVGALWRAASAAAAVAGAAAVAASRVYLRYHSVPQVAAGAAVGAACGGVWFFVVEALLRPRFAALARSPLGRALWLRDGTGAHVLLEEYRAVAHLKEKQ